MRVLVIPDKFKGSLSAEEVIAAISKGIRNSMPKAEITEVLASDGGDGFLNAVSNNSVCETVTMATVDPLGRKIMADYLLDTRKKTAYIELAKTSGLELLEGNERKVMETSTYGTGLQILHAIRKGATVIYIGLGGSATNDGGVGIAKALGYGFLDGLGHELYPAGKNLAKLETIEKTRGTSLTENISISAVNDVDNPLYGETGAAYMYSGQKGARKNEIPLLDSGLRNLHRVVQKDLDKSMAQIPGSGAAGGTAYGLKVFLEAAFVSGIDFVLNLASVDQMLQAHEYDYIITGEGKFDNQTLHGKLIKGVVDLGKKYDIPVVVVCGQKTINEEELQSLGLYALLETRDYSKPLAYSMDNAGNLVQDKMQHFFASI